MFSKTAGGQHTGEKAAKKDKEAGNRYDLTRGLAIQEDQMLALNENLPQLALPGPCRPQGGWKRLKVNNKSEDMKEHSGTELRHNKQHIMDTHTLCLQQSQDCMAVVQHELEALLPKDGDHPQQDASMQLIAIQERLASVVFRLNYVRKHIGEDLSALPGLLQAISRLQRRRKPRQVSKCRRLHRNSLFISLFVIRLLASEWMGALFHQKFFF